MSVSTVFVGDVSRIATIIRAPNALAILIAFGPVLAISERTKNKRHVRLPLFMRDIIRSP
jgi:hypothetical protein